MSSGLIFAMGLNRASAQNIYDHQGHYMGQAPAVSGMTAKQVIAYQEAQDFNEYQQRVSQVEDPSFQTERSFSPSTMTPYPSSRGDMIVRVPVIHITQVSQGAPIYNTVPTVQCQTVDVPVRQSGSTASTMLGSIIGGALGNQIGRGRGRRVATIGGAVLGGGIGYASSSRVVVVPQQHCFSTYVNEQMGMGRPTYDVTYLYPVPKTPKRGQRLHINPASVHHILTNHYPGQVMTIRLQAAILN